MSSMQIKRKDFLDLLARISQIRTKSSVDFESLSIKTDFSMDEIEDLALSLKPWRKGPFRINDLFIDAEWRSDIKFDIIKNYLNVQEKSVLDLGCNNGYYLFRLLDGGAKKLTGFDPSELFYTQFCFINALIQSHIHYELLGVENLLDYGEKFDIILCMGVLYHRKDPISSLQQIFASLQNNGELILDTLIIDSSEEICLCPYPSYAKMKNVHFIPSIRTLENWLHKVGFKDVEVIATKITDLKEQRKTSWIDTQSLQDFLSPQLDKTIEGYDAPKRCYLKARKPHGR